VPQLKCSGLISVPQPTNASFLAGAFADRMSPVGPTAAGCGHDWRPQAGRDPMPPAVSGCSRVTRQDPRIDANQFCRRYGAVSWR
jgi:hypothetical protein